MSEKAAAAMEIYQTIIGEEEGVGEWLEIDQERINLFADATLDHQFIHIDPEKSAEMSPYKVTIAHGFLTLSMIVSIMPRLEVPDVKMGINYGLDRVRFITPVPVDSKIRVRSTLAEVTEFDGGAQLKQALTVELEGSERPAAAIESLTRVYF